MKYTNHIKRGIRSKMLQGKRARSLLRYLARSCIDVESISNRYRFHDLDIDWTDHFSNRITTVMFILY